jgi:hypothetical protein
VSPEAKAVATRLRDDFEHYATKCLRVRTKDGGTAAFTMNSSQRELHKRIEAQRAAKGRVRAIVLKGRQQGVSTYAEGRFFWRVTHRFGVRAFVLTHRDDATANLFGMVDRFWEHCPEVVRPAKGLANAKELTFPGLDSGYAVGTAGGREVGRSSTIQYLHGSEVAFWTNAQSHIDGLFQAVPEVGETEVILESTAQGLGGAFHSLWQAAVRGESDYEAIFLPWFIHDEYQADPISGLSSEWVEYQAAHGLTDRQLAWAWRKSRDMGSVAGGDPDKVWWRFRQEYPATADEAFQSAGDAAFISPESIAKARKHRVIATGPLVFGVDPAREGRDATGVIDRQGRRMGGNVCELWRGLNTMEVAGRVARLIEQMDPVKVFVDVTGLGAGVVDRLHELGFQSIVEGVNFASSPVGVGPSRAEQYRNRRAEMWDALRDWFSEAGGVQIANDDGLASDLSGPIWGANATGWDSSGRLLLESKDAIVKRLGRSPDLGDAAALTFAAPVAMVARATTVRKPLATRYTGVM